MAEDANEARYDNSGRRALADETRNRIISEGAELLRQTSIRNWGSVTIRSVAERAEVSERTVYRHFGTEKGLRDAIMERQEEQAGIDLSSLGANELAEVAGRVLKFAAGYPRESPPPLDETLVQTDRRRHAALIRAIQESAPGASAQDVSRAAALVDILWSIAAYERLVEAWEMDGESAIGAVKWGIDLIVSEMTNGAGSPADPNKPESPNKPER